MNATIPTRKIMDSKMRFMMCTPSCRKVLKDQT
jgi:hypothetical protein